MKKMKRAARLLLCLALVFVLACPALAAAPLSPDGFAQVLVDARDKDFPELDLSLAYYQRGEGGGFALEDTFDLTTSVNRVTQDVIFHLTPGTDQVSVYVDYLTDLNGDGTYELLSGGQAPVGDQMTADSQLLPFGMSANVSLSAGASYAITGDALRERAEQVLQERATPGDPCYLALADSPSSLDRVIYLITLRYHCPQDGADYDLCYYLQLFQQLPIPSAADFSDVPAGAWYYNAVDYVVSHRLFSGTGGRTFSPDESLSRAMLAQILYRFNGSPDSGPVQFSDVTQDAWFYDAVAWVCSVKLMSGVGGGQFEPDGLLTREQLALILFQYAQGAGLDRGGRAGLDAYPDRDTASPWALEALEWGVAQGLFSGSDGGMLLPGGPVSRAEFAYIFQTFCQSVLD